MTTDKKEAPIETEYSLLVPGVNISAADLTKAVESVAITDQASLTAATELIVRITAAKKAVDEERFSYTRPLDTYKEMVMAKFKPYTTILDAARKTLESKIIAFQTKQRQDAEAAQAAAIAAAARETKDTGVLTPVTAQAMEKPATTVTAPSGQASSSTRWAYEITDKEKVPKEYWIVNEKAIAAAVRAGVRQMAGVRIYPVAGLRVS